MLDLLKSVFKYHRGAITAVAMMNIFTFIPAATVFWLDKENHFYYYGLIAAVAVLTSWMFHWTTKEARENTKYFGIKMILFFLLLAFLAAPVLLTFYFRLALFFANFFEVVYKSAYMGPDRTISFFIAFGFYNLFFIGDYLRGVVKLLLKR